MTKEIYKDISGFNGMYQVSNFGNIKSLYKNITMKPQTISSGYQSVRLTNNGKAKNFYIHRLVAQAFITNFETKPQVNHRDGDKQNNLVENLEWCTRSENDKHAWKNGLHETTRIIAREQIKNWNKTNKHSNNIKKRWKDGEMNHLVCYGENNHNSKLIKSQVKDIIKKFNLGDVSIAELARKYNVSWSTIKFIIIGKNWKY